MATYEDWAICLQRIDYSETSQVAVVLTREHGKQRLIAKGIKKGRKDHVAVGLDLLEFGRVQYVRRPESPETLGTLTGWRQRETFAGLRRDMLGVYGGQYAAEIVGQLTEDGDPHPGLFDAMVGLLESLAERPSLGLLAGFQRSLLEEIGLMPAFGRCVGCSLATGQARSLHLTAREGGLLCENCEGARVEKFRLGRGALAGCRLGAVASTSEAYEAFEMLDYYLTETMGRRSKVSGILKRLGGLARPGGMGGA